MISVLRRLAIHPPRGLISHWVNVSRRQVKDVCPGTCCAFSSTTLVRAKEEPKWQRDLIEELHKVDLNSDEAKVIAFSITQKIRERNEKLREQGVTEDYIELRTKVALAGPPLAILLGISFLLWGWVLVSSGVKRGSDKEAEQVKQNRFPVPAAVGSQDLDQEEKREFEVWRMQREEENKVFEAQRGN